MAEAFENPANGRLPPIVDGAFPALMQSAMLSITPLRKLLLRTGLNSDAEVSRRLLTAACILSTLVAPSLPSLAAQLLTAVQATAAGGVARSTVFLRNMEALVGPARLAELLACSMSDPHTDQGNIAQLCSSRGCGPEQIVEVASAHHGGAAGAGGAAHGCAAAHMLLACCWPACCGCAAHAIPLLRVNPLTHIHTWVVVYVPLPAVEASCAWAQLLESLCSVTKCTPEVRRLLAADSPLQRQLLLTASRCLSHSSKQRPALDVIGLSEVLYMVELQEMQHGLAAYMASGSGEHLLGQLAAPAASLPPPELGKTGMELAAAVLHSELSFGQKLIRHLTAAAGDAMARSGMDGGSEVAASPALLLPPTVMQPALALVRCLAGRIRALLRLRAAELVADGGQPAVLGSRTACDQIARECTELLGTMALLLPWGPPVPDREEPSGALQQQVRVVCLQRRMSASAVGSHCHCTVWNHVWQCAKGAPLLACLPQVVAQLALHHCTDMCAATEALVRMVGDAPLHAGALAAIWQDPPVAASHDPMAWSMYAVLATAHLAHVGAGDAGPSIVPGEDVPLPIRSRCSYSRHAAAELGGRLEPADAVRLLLAQCQLAASALKAALVLGTTPGRCQLVATAAERLLPTVEAGEVVAQALMTCMWAAEGAWKAFSQLPPALQEQHTG
jgi:hypothetical protein